MASRAKAFLLAALLLASTGAVHGAVPGRLMAWGDNRDGALGDGTWDASATPVHVKSLSGVVQVATGAWHSLAVRDDATVWAWGNNRHGQLGDGSLAHRPTPVQVVGITGAVAVAAGAWHSLALLQDGSVLAWGDNGGGELGDGTTASRSTPGVVPGLANVTAIAAGGDNSFALLANGTVAWWGPGSNLGTIIPRFAVVTAGPDGPVCTEGGPDGPSPCEVRRTGSTPKPLDGVRNATGLAAGSEHALFVLENGTVASLEWGYRALFSPGNQTGPETVPGLAGVRAVSTSGDHSLALLDDGTVMAWGENRHGQVGDGTTQDRLAPVAVPGLVGVQAVAAGDMHSLALLADGTVKSWGLPPHDGRGRSPPEPQSTPMTVCGLPPASSIAASQHALAIVGDGEVIEGCGQFPWMGIAIGLGVAAALAGLMVALRAASRRPWLVGRIAWSLTGAASVALGALWFLVLVSPWDSGYLFGQKASVPYMSGFRAMLPTPAFGLAWLLLDVGLAAGLWHLRRPRGEIGRWPLRIALALSVTVAALSLAMMLWLNAERPQTLPDWDQFDAAHGGIADLLAQLRPLVAVVLFVAAFGVRVSSRATGLGLGLLGAGLLAMSLHVHPFDLPGEAAFFGVLAAALGSGLVAWRGHHMAQATAVPATDAAASASRQ